MPLLYHAYVYLEFLILACTIYILAPTNALILELGMIAYNILRMIGQGTIGGRAPRQKRDVKRRRLRTVISNLIMMAGHVTMHARQLIIGLGKSNVWRHIFSDICQKYAVTNA